MSSAENDTRPVWMTEADARLYGGGLLRAWDAAPADPAEAVRDALIQSTDLPADERRLAIAVVLVALGMPT